MAKAIATQPVGDVRGGEETVALKDPLFAGFLAWLIPGAGHFYQGRTAKGILFMTCILATFFYGLFLGEGRVVYASWRPGDKRLAYICQVGVGLPALPALVEAYRASHGKPPLLNIMVPPNDEQLAEYHKQLGRYFELGTVYTMIAGLLNVLAAYDAWGGPLRMEPHEKKSRDGDSPDEESADS